MTFPFLFDYVTFRVQNNSVMILRKQYFLYFLLLCTGFSFSQTDTKYREFDFWLGEWNVYKHDTDSIVGKSKIESIVDGKAVRETYYSTTSLYKGTSLNKYNLTTNQWEQYWVDSTGLTLHIKGNIEKGSMILQNQVTSKEGTLRNKIKWCQNEDGTVRQTWYQSKDLGKNWTIVFDGDYKPAGND